MLLRAQVLFGKWSVCRGSVFQGQNGGVAEARVSHRNVFACSVLLPMPLDVFSRTLHLCVLSQTLDVLPSKGTSCPPTDTILLPPSRGNGGVEDFNLHMFLETLNVS